jgi:hypothetical protein
MGDNQELREALRALALGETHDMFAYAKVDSVDMQAKTCDATNINDKEDKLIGIKLRVFEGGDVGSYIIPKVGSDIFVAQVAKEESHLIWAAEPDKVVMSANKLVFDADEIIFNGGANGGIIVWDNLNAQLTKITQFMQVFMSVMATPSIPESGNGAPSSFHAALKLATQTIMLPNYTNIVETKIKH